MRSGSRRWSNRGHAVAGEATRAQMDVGETSCPECGEPLKVNPFVYDWSDKA